MLWNWLIIAPHVVQSVVIKVDANIRYVACNDNYPGRIPKPVKPTYMGKTLLEVC
jgi:hypothetical protein